MAFLGFFNKGSDWGGPAADDTTVGSFDPDYQGNSVVCEVNQASQFSWGNGAADVWIHFQFYYTYVNVNGNGNVDGYWFEGIDTNGNVVIRGDLFNGSLQFEVSGNGGTSFTSSAFGIIYGFGVRVTYDLHYQKNNGGNTTLDVYLGGVLLHSLSAANTTSGDLVTMNMTHDDMSDQISGTQFWYSEVMVADEDTRGLRVATLQPDGNGGETAWDGVFSDIIDRNDGRAISSDTAAQRESWTLSAYNGPASPTAVRGVFNQLWAHAGASGPTQVDPFVRIGGANYDIGVPVAPDFSTPVIGEWATNPATGVDWVGGDFATLEAGVESVT